MHALTCKAGGENLWGHTPEQHSTAYEKCASKPVHLPRDYPHKAFLCASGGSSASQELWRGGLSVPQAFPCPHAQVCQGWQHPQHSQAQCVGPAWQHLPGTSPQPQLPSPAPSCRNKKKNSAVHSRDPFREGFARFL